MKHPGLRRNTAALLALVLCLALFMPAARAIDGIVSIPIENKTMRAYVKGSGDHTVVLLSGWGTEDPINDFNPLVEKLSDVYRVVVPEYFGYGSSSQTSAERSNKNLTEEIRTALAKLEIKPPYILMPHGMSGLYSLYFADHYPEEVEGIIAQDRRFLHSYCFGMKVIGTLEDAESIILSRNIAKVVVTANLPDDFKARLKQICLDNGIGLFSFYACEDPVCLPKN